MVSVCWCLYSTQPNYNKERCKERQSERERDRETGNVSVIQQRRTKLQENINGMKRWSTEVWQWWQTSTTHNPMQKQLSSEGR